MLLKDMLSRMKSFLIKLLLITLSGLIVTACGIPFISSSAHAAQRQVDKDLIYQVTLGDTAEVTRLLEGGADANAVNDDGYPALALAAQRTDAHALPIATALLEHGANIEQRDPLGNTPIMNAIAANNPKLVSFLVKERADIFAIDLQGRNVAKLAEWYGNPDVVSAVHGAIDQYEEDNAERVSVERRNKVMRSYVLNICALQYLSFYRDSRQDPVDTPSFRKKLDLLQEEIGQSAVDLMHNYHLTSDYLEGMRNDVQKTIYYELENMISNRNRRKQGVGKASDLKKRCYRILAPYNQSWSYNSVAAQRQKQAQEQ